MPIVEFVSKLLEILENQGHIVRWINNGTEFEIIDLEFFTKNTLKHYFRHQKFESFIRQLNMYGFHKVNRRKNSYIFQHQHFVQNRKQSYCLIKRTKKRKLEPKNRSFMAIGASVDYNQLSEKAPNVAETLIKLIDFNMHNQFDYKELKARLDLLSKQVSAKKQRVLRPIIKNIREKLAIMDELSKKVSAINFSGLMSCSHGSPTKTNSEPNEQILDGGKKIMSAPVFGCKAQSQSYAVQDGASLNNLHSFNSISSFIVLN